MRHVDEVTAVRSRQRPGDRQAQTRTAAVAVAGLVEAHQPFEDPLALVFGHAGSRVSDGQHGAIARRANVDVDGPACRSVPSGVVDDVGEDLGDAQSISDYRHRRVPGASDTQAGRQDSAAVPLGVGEHRQVAWLQVQR